MQNRLQITAFCRKVNLGAKNTLITKTDIRPDSAVFYAYRFQAAFRLPEKSCLYGRVCEEYKTHLKK